MIRASVFASVPPAGLAGEVVVDLHRIAGVDPCNSRAPRADDDEGELAASLLALGQLQPMIVRGAPDRFLVLAGGRRFRALKAIEARFAENPSLAAGALLRPPLRVRVRVFTGADEAAREISLAENVQRRDLSALEEAERFAALALAEGFSRLAQRFGVTERFLRGRVKLAGLPEAAKAAWRAEKFGLETARALTMGSPEAIAALVENRPELLADPRAVRRALQPQGANASSPEARFVGPEAYCAAGGEILADLFGDEPIFLNAALLTRLAAEKLARLGEAICDAEGFGHVIVGRLPEGAVLAAPDFTAAEREALEAGDGLDTAEEAIVRRATLRAVARGDRKDFAVRVRLLADGGAEVTRAIRLGAPKGASPVAAGAPAAAAADPEPPRGRPHQDRRGSPSDVPQASEGEDFAALAAEAARAPLSRSPLSRSGEGPGVRVKSLDAAPALPHPARRAALAAASRAVAQAAAADEAFALALGLAALAKAGGSRESPVGLRRDQGPWSSVSASARDLVRRDFVSALARAEELELGGLVGVLAELAAASVDLREAGEAEIAAALACARRMAGAPGFDAALAAAFDYPAFFRLASRYFSLSAIGELAGPAAERRAADYGRDEAVADEAASLARAQSWLPHFLRSPS
jgi:ParB-like chromosome segregation protein Spo0J